MRYWDFSAKSTSAVPPLQSTQKSWLGSGINFHPMRQIAERFDLLSQATGRMIWIAISSHPAIKAASRLLAKTGWLSNFLFAALTHFTYLALVVVLIGASAGVPIPEDIPLIFCGYLCNRHYSPIRDLTRAAGFNEDGTREMVHRHIPHLEIMILAGLIGVIAGDLMVFSIGRRGLTSDGLIARHLRKVMHTQRRERFERHFARHGNLTVFFGRFLPGARSLTFAMAGMSGMPLRRFLIIDGLAAAISVPLFLFIGWRFAAHVAMVLAWIQHAKLVLLPALGVIVLLGIAIYLVRRRNRRRTEIAEQLAMQGPVHGDE